MVSAPSWAWGLFCLAALVRIGMSSGHSPAVSSAIPIVAMAVLPPFLADLQGEPRVGKIYNLHQNNLNNQK